MKFPKTIYFVRSIKEFETVPEAENFIKLMNHPAGPANPGIRLQVGYHMPQPIYKTWVPYWLIRLTIKNKKS